MGLWGRGSLAFPGQACQRHLENLEADLGGVFVRRETRHQLLVWMDIVSEVAQSVNELLDVELHDTDHVRYIDQLCEAPFAKSFGESSFFRVAFA